MKVEWIDYSAELLCPMSYENALLLCETAGRTCYQSLSKMSSTIEGSEAFLRSLISKGHESVVEHASYSMEVTLDRGLLAEWTRHRIGSAYSVESTRYVNYANRGKMECVLPSALTNTTVITGGHSSPLSDVVGFKSAVQDMANAYEDCVRHDVKPEVARALLPQCLAVRMVVTHNARQWRHILRERMVNPYAHPDIRRLMVMCHKELSMYAPVFFEDIQAPINI